MTVRGRMFGLVLFLVLAAVLPACDPMAQVVEPTVPTPTLSGTATATPTATLSPTPRPTATPELTATPTPFPCDEDGLVIDITDNHSETAREDIPYTAYLPPCYGSSSARFPLLLLIAPGPGRRDLMETLNLPAILDEGIRSGAYPPAIVVIAELGRLGSRAQFPPDASASTVIKDELLPAIQRDFCVVEQRTFRAIGGFGQGGFWAIHTAFTAPDLFSVIGGHSAVLDNSVPPAENPLEIARNSTILPNANFRMYFDNGAPDEAASNGLQLLSDRLTARQIPHTYIINPVGQADAEYWASHVEEYLEFYGRTWPRDYGVLPDCREPSP